VGGTGNLDGVDTTHIAATSGGAGGASYPAAGDDLTFDSSSGGGTVTFTAGVTLSEILMGSFGGTVDTNGQTVTLAAQFNLTGSGTRTLTLGASSISTPIWNANNPTNLTLNAGTSTITCSSTFEGGSKTYATVVLTDNSLQSLNGSNTFGTLTRTGGAFKTGGLSLGGNQTFSGTFTVNGNSAVNRLLVFSSAKGTARTITAATVTVTNADFQDITGAGAGSWNLSAITGGSGDCGGNSNITFTTPATQYWQHGASASYNWSDSTRWFLATNGGGGAGRVPLPQDTARFDANSFGAAGKTVVQDMTRIGAVDWTGVTNTPTWTTSTVASFFGSITLVSGMTLTASTQAYTYEGRGSSTITMAGKSWGKAIAIFCFTGTLSLGDAFSSTSSVALDAGTFSSAGFSMTVSAFNYSSSNSQILNMGNSTWTLTGNTNMWSLPTGMTVNAGTSTIRLTGAFTSSWGFYGGGHTYHRLEVATTGAFALQFLFSNTFTGGIYIDASAAARTVLFTAGTTQRYALPP
jgi:hypothetical protein